VAGVQQETQELKAAVVKLEAGQSRLETRLDKVEVKLEKEVSDRIRILFDAWKVHEDNFREARAKLEKLDDIALDVRYLVARVTMLEKAAK
ncbi:MAG: hypothetical protein HPY81_09435, partial [Firmicutes bacterium]|nr:hypothetical protein [Bacillota bacterium]